MSASSVSRSKPPRRYTPSSPLRASISADETVSSSPERRPGSSSKASTSLYNETDQAKEGLKQPHTPGLIPPTPLSPTRPDDRIPSPTDSSSSTLASVSGGSVPSSTQIQSRVLSTSLSSQHIRAVHSTIDYPMSARSTTNHALLSPLPSASPHPQSDLSPSPQPEPANSVLVRPANFEPFFTLMADLDPTANSADAEATTYHPSRIHYLFSDDEDAGEAISEACLRSLGLSSTSQSPSPSPSPSPSRHHSAGESPWEGGDDGGRVKKSSRRRDKHEDQAAREERMVVVDVNATGDKILNAHSLTSTWQVLNAEICGAPIWDGLDDRNGDAQGEKGSGKGLMLRIEGVSRHALMSGSAGNGMGLGIKESAGGIGTGPSGSSAVAEEDMQALLEGFDRKMGLLRKIVGAGSAAVGAVERREAG